jgi:hypothetical protein
MRGRPTAVKKEVAGLVGWGDFQPKNGKKVRKVKKNKKIGVCVNRTRDLQMCLSFSLTLSRLS